MHIECPSCTTENKIEFGDNIICSKCKKSFTGHTYKKFKKPFLSATAALLLGVYGTYKIDQVFFEIPRYPIGVEYELVDLCINSSANIMDSPRRNQKRSICICALENTMKEVTYKQFIESEREFSSHFRNSLLKCQ
jgi:hypothetical protein